MDPLTHCLIGSVSAKAVKASPRRFWIMTFLGSAPDLDVLFNGLGGWAVLFQHRGITHSFLGVFLQVLFYSFLFRRWDKGSFRERAVAYSFPLGLHLFCDYLTSYGVPLFSPFSLVNFSWDLTGSVNLFPLALTLVGLWWLHTGRLSGWGATAPVWGIWMLYFMLVFTGRSYAATLAGQPNTAVIPSMVSPFSWRAVTLDEKNHDYRLYTVNLLSRQVTYLGCTSQPGTDFPVQKSLNSPLVKNFIKDNRWPVVRVTSIKGGWRVEWGNIIYSVRGMIRGKVAVDVAADGRVLSESPIISFWDLQLN